MQLTKETLRDAVVRTAVETGVADPSGLALKVLQSGAFELDSTPPSEPLMEWVVIGSRSMQGTRTHRKHVNIYALVGTVLTALATTTPAGVVGVVVSLCGACTVSLTPDQAAFFTALHSIEKQGGKASVASVTQYMAGALNDPTFAPKDLRETIKKLQQLGVEIDVGPTPTERIRCSEGRWILPGI